MPDPGSREWLEAQVAEYSRLHPRYLELCGAIEDVLGSAAARHAPRAIVQSRAKKPPSFAEKCLRKAAKYAMPAHQLTDLCGARLIARTATELHAVSRYLEERLDIDWENSDEVSQRLSWAEFGYRSIHYVLSLRPGDEVDDDLLGFVCEAPGCTGMGTFHPLKAEVQVRTLAEHAWADFAHDITYKGAFLLPDHWLREVALMAADLEDVDRTVERIEAGLRAYAASYGTYLDPDTLDAEIRTLETVLEYDPENAGLARRIGKLAMTAGDWERAVAVMDPFVDSERPGTAHVPLLRDLGVSLGKQGETVRGRRYLEAAIAEHPDDSDAIASLAGTWRSEDPARAQDLYRRAMDADPTDYYPLLNYVDGEIERSGTAAVLDVFAPMAAQALARCEAHIAVGVNMPWAVSSMAKFQLYLGDPYAALDWYCQAIRTATAEFMVPTLDRIGAAADRIEGYEWAHRLLLLARAFHYGDGAARKRLAALADVHPIVGPVLVVTGGTDARYADQIEAYRPVLAGAFESFSGTVISGGTLAGVCSMTGELGAAAGDRIHTVGYVPDSMPLVAQPDARYDEMRTTEGEDFSPLEPLQYWIDLLASGIDPADVVVIGIGGGPIAAAECRIALAFGARVAVVSGSGRETSRLLSDPRWIRADNLVPLPADRQTARALVAPPIARLADAGREALAKELHRAYREEVAIARADDPAQRPWEALSDDLKQSNLSQVDAIVDKVQALGCVIRPAGDAPPRREFTPDEVERLAEMEHGRWTADRLRSGWRWGPERDLDARVSPHLVPWSQLADDIRDYDREFVRRIPALLADVGLDIVEE